MSNTLVNIMLGAAIVDMVLLSLAVLLIGVAFAYDLWRKRK